jgi:hypothetical protein
LAAPVGLLNRNVRILGAEGPGEGESYGAHVVVMDVQFDEERVKVGSSHLSNVELQRCGKLATEHACMLFKYDRKYADGDQPENVLESVVMRESLNYGIVSEGSDSLTVRRSILHRTYRSAIDLDSMTLRATLLGNLIVDNRRSPDDPEDWVKPFAGIYADTYSVTMIGNVVSGGADAGFTFRPNTCDLAAPTIRDNEAMAVLVGAFLLPDRKACLSLQGMTVWKAAHVGILTVDQDAEVHLTNAVISDSHIGLSLNFFRVELHSHSRVRDSVIMGSTLASTCAASLSCRAATASDVAGRTSTCGSVLGPGYRHVGVLLPQYTNRGKTCARDFLPVCRPPNRPERLCAMPWEQRYGLPSTQHAQITFDNVVFAHFNRTGCADTQSVGILTNPTQRNYVPEQWYSRIRWHATPLDAQFYFAVYDRTLGECATGCDALNYLLAHDVDGTFTGGAAGSEVTSSSNPGLVDGEARCVPLEGRGAIRCSGLPLKSVVLESKDRDSGFVRLGPVLVQRLDAAFEPTERFHASVGPFDGTCGVSCRPPSPARLSPRPLVPDPSVGVFREKA